MKRPCSHFPQSSSEYGHDDPFLDVTEFKYLFGVTKARKPYYLLTPKRSHRPIRPQSPLEVYRDCCPSLHKTR